MKVHRFQSFPIHSYLNEGQGPVYYAEGEPQWEDETRKYNNINDYDFNFPFRKKYVKLKYYY